MSVHVSSLVWSTSKQEGHRLLLLLALADIANDEAICWPSQDTLTERIRGTRRGVQKILQALIAEGEIEIVEKGGNFAGDQYRSTTYRLTRYVPDLPGRANGVRSSGKGERRDAKGERGDAARANGVRRNHKREPSIEPSEDMFASGEVEKKETAPLPYLSEEFRLAWDAYLSLRKEKRATLTETAKALCFGKFKTWGEAASIQSLLTSVERGWTGVFEPKQSPSRPPGVPSIPTQRRRSQAEIMGGDR